MTVRRSGERAAANASKAILGGAEGARFLRELGVAEWDLSTINPNRLKFLAQLGRKATSQALQRLAHARRYPIVAAFLRHSMEELPTNSWSFTIAALPNPIPGAGQNWMSFA